MHLRHPSIDSCEDPEGCAQPSRSTMAQEGAEASEENEGVVAISGAGIPAEGMVDAIGADLHLLRRLPKLADQ